MHKLLVALVGVMSVGSLASVVGCAGAEDGESTSPATSEGALATSTRFNLKEYAMVTGIVAMGDEARVIYEAIKANGGKKTGDHSVLAGLTGKDLGLEEDGDEDESFGISCTAKEGDSTFRQDTCSVLAVVQAKAQKKKGASGILLKMSGRLAGAVLTSLPSKTPPGMVGSNATGVGKIECSSPSGRTSLATCTVPVVGATESFHTMVNSTEAPLKVEDAEKIIDAFF